MTASSSSTQEKEAVQDNTVDTFDLSNVQQNLAEITIPSVVKSGKEGKQNTVVISTTKYMSLVKINYYCTLI